MVPHQEALRLNHNPSAAPGWPEAGGRFGTFGGRFVPETLMTPLQDLEETWDGVRQDGDFWNELLALLRSYGGRPTPLYEAERLARPLGGCRIFLKREDLGHTGSHKLNSCLGQAMLALRTGKKRVVAETASGHHGVAAATACARSGLECQVYMGLEDTERQALNVRRMEMLGAHVTPVETGTRTLKDAITAALREWATRPDDTYYMAGSVTGPHPYPWLVRDLQSIIGVEARRQILTATGRLPSAVVASAGRGSDAMGMFYPFLSDPGVRLIGVGAAGVGLVKGLHAASLVIGSSGVLHGAHSMVLQDSDGQIDESHSVAPGLDYPGSGPEHAFLKSIERAEYVAATDDEAIGAYAALARAEGIVPGLEPAHALAHALELAPKLGPDAILLLCLSSRGEKDLQQVQSRLAPPQHRVVAGRGRT